MSHQTQKRTRQRNRQRTKRSTIFYLAFMVLGVLTLAGAYTMRTTIASALPQTPEQALRAVWQTAGEIGRYDYSSNVLQTTNPTPRLENVGRRPRTEQMSISGTIDRWQEAMHLQMDLPNQAPMEVKVEEDMAYGRLQHEEQWHELENGTELFAPGGDPMGFLSAMENVRILTPPLGSNEAAPSPDWEGSSHGVDEASAPPPDSSGAGTFYAKWQIRRFWRQSEASFWQIT
ncbi:hypothetical protein KFU94_36770 [Chloroflexi bacterium TSY]|nr:hypothetical protein [Chloroflexi bacterium TSY]